MLLKEKNYDGFLAKKIRESEAEFAAGKFLTLEQSKAQSEMLLLQLEQEMQKLEQGYQYT